MSAKNFPYEKPSNLYDLFTRGVDHYKENYDRVFPAYKPKFQYVGEFLGMKVFSDRDAPPNSPIYVVNSDYLKGKAKT